jgi:hypothetical protein
MASSGKKKTTMAKLNRESKLRERKLDKQARKDARKYAAAHGEPSYAMSENGATGQDATTGQDGTSGQDGAIGEDGATATPAVDADVPALADA